MNWCVSPSCAIPVGASPAEPLRVDGHVLCDGEDGEGESLDEGVAVLLLQLGRTLPREALVEVHIHRLDGIFL